jgi:hypothetical protein
MENESGTPTNGRFFLGIAEQSDRGTFAIWTQKVSAF